MKRFWDKVEKTDYCWNWKANKYKDGYGQFSIGKRKIAAHRYSYILARGDIQEDFVVDHLCGNKSCVNPLHLEVVTQKENVKRGIKNRTNINKTHCKRGHIFDEENTYINSKGRKVCRQCIRDKRGNVKGVWGWKKKKVNTTQEK